MPEAIARAAPSARCARSFFETDPSTLARRLIGQRLVRILDDGTRLSGLIVETEAYLGVEDRAAHSFGGRRTLRNEAMYMRAGTAYVYFTYGMHYCANVVCGEVGEPVAVLVRALEPVEGLDEMRLRRAASSGGAPRDQELCSGPAKLCQALNVDRRLDQSDLVDGASLFLERARSRAVPDVKLAKVPRVGIPFAGEWASKSLRWYLRDSAHVSVRVRGR